MAKLMHLPDIMLPPAISAWPPAIGWLFVYVGSVVVMLVLAYKWFRYWQKTRAKRAAYKLICQLEQKYQRQKNTRETVTELAALLRRVCLVYYPRKAIASLHGQDWLVFLDKAGKTQYFSQHAQALVQGPYQRQVEIDITQLIKHCKKFIKAGHYV